MRLKILTIALITLYLSVPAGAQSLWKSAASPAPTAGSGSLFTDKKAHQVGDLITILVVESSSASQKADTTVTKKSSVDVKPGVGPLLNKIPALGFGGNTSSVANGTTSRSSNLTAQITATVTEVKPNGVLVITGDRNVTANTETQTLRITGTVRPEDITPENTVLSTAVADAKIAYSGKGSIAERQKPGIITRIFKLLF